MEIVNFSFEIQPGMREEWQGKYRGVVHSG